MTGPDTLHYVDPPYVHATRNRRNPYDPKHQYRHELSDADHVALLDALRGLAGMVVLSGYPCALYDDALPAGAGSSARRSPTARGRAPRCCGSILPARRRLATGPPGTARRCLEWWHDCDPPRRDHRRLPAHSGRLP
jgi:hypothetical protein